MIEIKAIGPCDLAIDCPNSRKAFLTLFPRGPNTPSITSILMADPPIGGPSDLTRRFLPAQWDDLRAMPKASDILRSQS